VTRPFRFGVVGTGSTAEEWQTFARKAEDLGYSTLGVQDHFGKQFAPLPALMAAAAVTSRLRLTTIVLGNDFRHPVVLAKDVATMDVLTGGRIELGLGAGWLQADYQQAGMAYDPPGKRLERLAESVAICRAFFAGETVSYQGRHFQVRDLEGFPKTTQHPRLPIMIGGRQRRMLSFAAQEADIVGVSLLDRAVPGGPKPPSFEQKVRWVREAAGSRIDHIELHINASNLVVTDNASAALDQIAGRLGVPAEEALASPAVIVGNVDACVERLCELRERYGVSYFVVREQALESAAPVVARATGM